MKRPVRWLVVMFGLLIAGAIGGYRFRDQREIERLAERTRQLEEQRRTLQQVVERLTAERRVADVYVLDQRRGADGAIASTDVRFVEFAPDGSLRFDRAFSVPGEIVYFDGLVIKFLDEYVEHGDALRGCSIVLFQRLYGAVQAPIEGQALDCPGQVPEVYRTGGAPGEWEQQLWRDFWDLARQPEQARRRGVRVAQGEAVYAPMRAGEHWQLSIERDGGLNLIVQTPAGRTPAPRSGAGSST